MFTNRVLFAAATAAAVLGASSTVFAQATATATPVGGANIPASIPIDIRYTVDAAHSADPANTAQPAGTDTTFKTLTRALEDALEQKDNGNNVVVNIVPGTYYDSFVIPGSSLSDTAWLTIQRRPGETGAVVLSGATKTYGSSLAWNTGWTRVTGTSNTDPNAVWRHTWPYNYTLSPDKRYYANGPDLSDTARFGPKVPLTRRKELLFVGTTMLRQVGSTFSSGASAPSASVMVDSSFHVNVDTTDPLNPPVSGTNKYVFMNPPGSVNPNGASVEVAERESVMSIGKRRNVILRNLNFTRATGYQYGNEEGYGLNISGGCANILIEDCRAYHNNNVGVRFAGEAIDVLRLDASDNGLKGMKGGGLTNIRFTDSKTNRNNFRGDWADYISGAAPSGFKFQGTRNSTWIRHEAVDNFCRGMWWDGDNTNIYAESCYMSGNVYSGMFIEISQGPTLINRCIIRDTFGGNSSGDETDESPQFVGGLLINCSTDVTLQSNIVFNNALWQLRIGNSARRDYQQGSISPRNFSFKNNVFLAQTSDQIGLTFPTNGPSQSTLWPYSGIYTTMDSGVATATSGPNLFWNQSGRIDLFGTTTDDIAARPYAGVTGLVTRNLNTARGTLNNWRAYSDQERESLVQAPGFQGPSENNFNLANPTTNPLRTWNLPTGRFD